MAVVHDEPEPMATYNPYLPDDLAAIIARCLAKPAEHRYQDAATLEYALAHSQRAEHWTEARAQDWWSHHPNALPGTGTDLESLALKDPETESTSP
jgi:hypothetical protein